jgi:hypothetical protein
MVLAGVADVVTDHRVQAALELGIPLYGGTEVAVADMREADLAPAGSLDNLITESDIVVDCTPKKVASLNRDRYGAAGRKAIVVPETINAIRAMTGLETDGARSIAQTDASLGIRKRFFRSSATVGIAVA